MTVKAGVIFIWTGTNATIPSGWERVTALDGYFPKGTAAETNPGTTGGNSTHSHTSDSHTHTNADHTHTVYVAAGTSGTACEDDSGTPDAILYNHTHANSTSGSVSGFSCGSASATYASVSNNPPYHEVIFITPTSDTADLPTGVVCLFDTSVPDGFYACDGNNSTPNLVDKYIRGAATSGDAGGTGGSTTNIHTLNHTHTTSHSHSAATSGTGNNVDRNSKVAAGSIQQGNHTHSITLPAVTPSTTDGDTSLTTTETVEPAYTKLLAIKNSSASTAPNGAIGLWIGTLANIPNGWILCDGDNGTVDMVGRHLKITATVGEIGNTGGSNSHTHASQNHGHNVSHTHSTSITHPNAVGSCTGSGATVTNSSTTHAVTSSTVNLVLSDAATTANSSSNEPLYTTVAFIKSNMVTTEQTISAKANIFVLGKTRTVTAKASVKHTDINYTITAKARIEKTETKTITAVARIQRNAETKTVTAKSSIKKWSVTRQISAKASIKQWNVTRQISAKASVKQWNVTHSISAKSSVKQWAVTRTVSAKVRTVIFGTPKIKPGIIFIWTGNHSAIPTNWERVTDLDGRFIKGTADATNPGDTGGSSTHSHSSSSSHTHTASDHTHTLTASTGTGGNVQTDSGDDGRYYNHTHSTGTSGAVANFSCSSQTPDYESVSNNPPYYEVIFITPSIEIKDGIIPSGVITLADADAPAGFYICDGDNSTPNLVDKYLRGAATSGNAGSTGGSTTNVHNLSHTHTTSHTHESGTISGESGSVCNSKVTVTTGSSIDQTHSVTLPAATPSSSNTPSLTTTETVEPAYRKLLAIQASDDIRIPYDVIGLWLGELADIPTGWYLCDGNNDTYDMRGKYAKITGTVGDVGATGGSNTHTHASQNHSHTISHSHSNVTVYHTADKGYEGSGGYYMTSSSTYHTVSSSTEDLVLADASTSANSASNEPLYTTVAFIKNSLVAREKSISAKSSIKHWDVTRQIQAKASVKQWAVTRQIQAKASIKQWGVTRTISAKASVKQWNVTRTISAKAAIMMLSLRTITAKARVQRKTRWTISSKASVKQFNVTRTITSKGRVKVTNLKTVDAKARVIAYGTPSIKAGMIFIWSGTNASIPANWERVTALDGYFIKGTANETEPGDTGGNSTHSHTSPSHTHTMNAHTHTMYTSAGTGGSAETDSGSDGRIYSHTHADATSGAISSASVSSTAVTYASVSNNPPYYEVIFITPTIEILDGILPEGVIGLFDSTLPDNFYLCDGNNSTPNLSNKYLRGASAGSNSGGEGGSTTNTHSISHSHTTSHGHSAASVGAESGGTNNSKVDATVASSINYIHSVSLPAATPTASDTISLVTTETVEPEYRKLLTIYSQGTGVISGMICMWLGDLAEIPTLWALCDGDNGTFDMRGKYLKSTAIQENIGATGGSNSHTHASQSHSHAGVAHTHTTTAYHPQDKGYNGSGNYYITVYYTYHTITTSSVNMQLADQNTTADSSSNEPVYKTVAFIKYVFGATIQRINAKASIKQFGVSQTISAKARVERTREYTISAKASIQVLDNLRTISAKARIITTAITQTISAKARIIKGATQTISAKASIFKAENTKTITAKGSIQQLNVTHTISAKASIFVSQTKNISAKARVKRITRRTITAKARVEKTEIRTIQAKASVKQWNVLHTISAKARILVLKGKLISAKASIFKADNLKTVTAKAAIEHKAVTYSIQAKARILRIETYTISAKARIAILDITKNIQAKARIEQTRLKTVSTKASIAHWNVTRQIFAKASIKQWNNTYTIQAKSSIIQWAVTRNITAKARVQRISRFNVDSKARVQRITRFNVDALASILRRNGSYRRVQAKARIQRNSETKLISAIARIERTETQTIQAKARTQRITRFEISAKASIKQLNVLQIISALARIERITRFTISAKANIRATLTKTVSAKGSIKQFSQTQTVTAKALIQRALVIDIVDNLPYDINIITSDLDKGHSNGISVVEEVNTKGNSNILISEIAKEHKIQVRDNYNKSRVNIISKI